MKLSHEFTVPADPDRAWALLTDLHKVGSCFPGATVTEATEQDFSGTVKVKLGPIAMMYAGSGRFVERDDAAHTAVIEAQGKDKRGNGTAGATVSLRLVPDGSGSRAEVSTDLNVTGKPAQFGRGVMQDVSDKLLGQFISCVEQQLGDGGDADDATEPAGETPTDDAAGPAVDPEGAAAAPGAATGDPAEQPPPVPRPDPTPRPAPAAATPGGWHSEQDDAIDLGSAVGPVLVKRYGGYALAGLLGLLLGLALRRRGTHEEVTGPGEE